MINTIVEIEHIQDFNEQGFNSNSYLGLDKRLNRKVAVKDIIYENLTSEADFEKFFEEAYKLSMASHPRVLPVYYVGLDQNNGQVKIPRIVTYFFKNGSLNSHLANVFTQGRTLGLDEVIRYAHDIIQGMIHLHTLDIVHLDLKASNIYISDDFKMVIGDFGQAKFIKDGIINNPGNIYPAIVPAEANRKKVVDKTADVYQFGLLLYSMLCYDQYRYALDSTYKINTNNLKAIYRDKPENFDELKHDFNINVKAYFDAVKNLEFPNRTSYPHYVPQEIQDVIHKCLEANISERYNNFYQIQDELNDFIFPKGVSDFHQNLLTNDLHFNKDEKPCVISIVPNGNKFDVSSLKNKKAITDCKKSGVSSVMLPKVLFKFASDI